MNFRSHTFPSDSVYRAVSTIMCILFNVALAFLTRKLGLPLYFDSVGIILMSFLGGSFSGIVTAVATNVLCCLFNPESLYFTLVGVLIALAAAAVTDTLGALLFPTGPYFPLFLFTEMAGSFVFALFLYRTKIWRS